MSFVSRLIEMVVGPGASRPIPAGAAAPAEDHLAAAALLVHVARIDGDFAEAERATIAAFLRDRFALPAEVAEALLARAGRIDREVDDIADLVEMMGHEIDEPDRRRLLATAYGVAAADGVVREFEDDLVWRMGQLLGFDDAAIAGVRLEVVGRGSDG